MECVKTWANTITLARFILILPFLIFLQQQTTQLPALILAIVIVAADKLDGMVARRYNQTTTIGAAFDTITDTVFIVVAFVVLFMQQGWEMKRLIAILFPRIIIMLLDVYLPLIHGKILILEKTALNRIYAGGLYLLLLMLLLGISGAEVVYVAITIVGIAYAGTYLTNSRVLPRSTLWKK